MIGYRCSGYGVLQGLGGCATGGCSTKKCRDFKAVSLCYGVLHSFCITT